MAQQVQHEMLPAVDDHIGLAAHPGAAYRRVAKLAGSNSMATGKRCDCRSQSPSFWMVGKPPGWIRLN